MYALRRKDDGLFVRATVSTNLIDGLYVHNVEEATLYSDSSALIGAIFNWGKDYYKKYGEPCCRAAYEIVEVQAVPQTVRVVRAHG